MKLLLLFLSCISAGVGFAIMQKILPSYTIDRNIGMDDALSLLFALPLAAFVFDKWLEQSRHVKDYLIQEMRSYLDEMNRIQEYVYTRNESEDQNISKGDKQFLMRKNASLERKINSLDKQISKLFWWKGKNLIQNIKNSYFSYWKGITEELHKDGAKIDSAYVKILNENYDCHSHDIKMGIFKLNSY